MMRGKLTRVGWNDLFGGAWQERGNITFISFSFSKESIEIHSCNTVSPEFRVNPPVEKMQK